MNHYDLGLADFIMDFESGSSQFTAHSRKDALKDIIGGLKASLARAMSDSFEKGALLRIENGIFRTENDTLNFAGIFKSALGSYNIQGFVVGSVLSATLSNKSGYKGSVKGLRKIPPLPLRDYTTLFSETMETTREQIYNRDILETKDWKAFQKKMEDVSAVMQDDIEMLFAFYYYASKLPISHYSLTRPFSVGSEEAITTGKMEPHRPTAFLEEKSASTAYLKITSFGGTAAEMDSIFNVIDKRGYNNLIVDLRGNPGGSVEAGMAFATRVADDVFYGGVFLTQKYFNRHKTLPSLQEYENFPHFTESNYDLLMEGIHNTEGVCLKIVPKVPVYKGKLYILVNGKTASTCEPIIYGFKQRKRALIVGTTTAGAMLAGEMFDLPEGFRIFLPTADYYAQDGLKIDKVGVTPDIDTETGDALQFVLQKLIKL
ncbi:S41 family peptidase [uncultured Flavobacterium sp.]|uniref:S41 family peptidase n=1 Tax=uncultured Flavobacterium sp. TaxID=165435 RepID=UPI0025D99DFE|nr:S41 family peptidase [uncultured Flavobacterium sp.]